MRGNSTSVSGDSIAVYPARRLSDSEIATIEQPVRVIRAGIARQPGAFDMSASPTAPDLAARFRRGRDVLLAGQSHFIPMEVPERVAEEISR